eukprot:GHVT01086679.1.p1 GENE.GHVT01086679.1~~GHVT01086679.1.p1  ORF type:complete len:314 (+),score=44.60 GHVT01086679.1:141-1082(+)
MAFVKLVKNRAYFKRYQVKYRRRREGRTDYHARRRLVLQDKNKYNARKHRFVVRMTNQKIICQVIYSTVTGDHVICQSDSQELPNYGVSVGLCNYPAAYATGLLCARRLLKKQNIDSVFKGKAEVDGEDYRVEEQTDGDRRPFKCLLDVGIIRTTTGNRVFGAMKGACDGGLHIPHSVRRFPGYACEGGSKTGKYDASVHRDRILGKHVSNYMTELKEEEPEKFAAHFSKFIKAGVTPESLEAMYKKAHSAIRANPVKPTVTRKHEPVKLRQGNVIKTSKGSYRRHKKLTLDARKERVAKKMKMAFEVQEAAE